MSGLEAVLSGATAGRDLIGAMVGALDSYSRRDIARWTAIGPWKASVVGSKVV